ncbi:unnamed protein product [Owenia fusiformis]|uniref:AB hydrolase-1 domain-containing protein n=1 Tax=Owenia fusiformis TaxID=6347 RepID=A0A8S4NQ67_OWEFU|nr:unnamed protein product [Owenia fusiformis]
MNCYSNCFLLHGVLLTLKMPLPRIGDFLYVWGSAALWGTYAMGKMLKGAIRHPILYMTATERTERPKCLDDPSLGAHEYLQLKDVKLHYVANGDKSKPLMLCLHGFPEFWYSWRHQLKEFSKDFRVVALDNRGYGDSDKPEEIAEYSLLKLTNDVKEVIERLGYKSCVLVGHDWGANIAWVFTIRFPSLVDKLIIMNVPHPKVFIPYIREHREQYVKSWYVFFYQLPYLPEHFLSAFDFGALKGTFLGKTAGVVNKEHFTKEDMDAYLYVFSQPGAFTGPVNYYRALLRQWPYTKKPSASKGPTIDIPNVPVLVVWGDQDGALEADMAKLSGNYVNNFTLKFVRGCSHWVQQEEPIIVNDIMRTFLENPLSLKSSL